MIAGAWPATSAEGTNCRQPSPTNGKLTAPSQASCPESRNRFLATWANGESFRAAMKRSSCGHGRSCPFSSVLGNLNLDGQLSGAPGNNKDWEGTIGTGWIGSDGTTGCLAMRL